MHAKPALEVVHGRRGRPRTGGLRQRILTAAEGVFVRRDFHEVRMDQVARESGVAKGTLYLYFPGKRELYLAVLLEGVDRLRGSLAAVAAAPDPPLDRLRAMVAGLLAHLWQRRRLLAFLLRPQQRLRPNEARQWLRRREALSRLFQSTIEEAIARGDLRGIHPPVAEEMLLGIVRGLERGRRGPGSTERLARRALDLFLRGTGREPRLPSRRRAG